MVAEAQGSEKRSEDIRWLVNFVRRQAQADGQAYIDFGEPVPLAERLEELAAEPGGGGHEVERVALDVSHRINQVTPVIPAAVVTIALLAANRGLTRDEVVQIVRPLAEYFNRRGSLVACDGRLDDPTVVARALDELVTAGGAIRHDGGREPVWALGRDQHLIAAFYRNSALHFLVDRAVAELACQAAEENPERERRDIGGEVALQLRDLLKFEFFFARKRDFLKGIEGEIELIDETPGGPAARAAGAEAVPRVVPRGRGLPVCAAARGAGRRGGVPAQVPRRGPPVAAPAPPAQRRVGLARAVPDRRSRSRGTVGSLTRATPSSPRAAGVFADEVRQVLRWVTSLERRGTVISSSTLNEVQS